MGLHPRVRLARWELRSTRLLDKFRGSVFHLPNFQSARPHFRSSLSYCSAKNRPSGKLYVGTFINLRKKTTAFSKYKLMKGGGGGGGKGETLM